MPIAGTYSFNLTRDAVISGALRLVGAIAEGETPNATQIATASDALNQLTKAWQAKLGLPIWSVRQITIPLVVGKASYNTTTDLLLTYKPLELLEVVVRSSTNNDIPIIRLSRQEYMFLNSKTSTGSPNQFYYDSQQNYGVINVWPVPIIAGDSLVVNLRIPLSDFNVAIDTPDFPSEWLRALRYGLACDLADEYGVSTSRANKLEQKLKMIIDDTECIGMENASVYFGKSVY